MSIRDENSELSLIDQKFVETKLATKYGVFNIRVYKDKSGKETVVLSTQDLDASKDVLVRVHSECITGDTIGSLHCDCGKQLERSLQAIRKEGGVLVYLRQEGRGIGLFEKIKTYQLQSKGYDTFEANILLGHNPDERTYEKVKEALDDLGIDSIRLLTNNPSKVSEIAKLGINVVERVPLIIRSNKHNKKYIETKKNKFQHSFKNKSRPYFYQFHANNVSQIKEIGDFIKKQKRDPLLEICVGISANKNTLSNSKELKKLKSLFQACEQYKSLIPVLHFTFQNSDNPLNDLDTIKKKLPFVDRLQLNDLPDGETVAIKKASSLFSIDVPFSDDNFHLLHNSKLRNLLKSHGAYILLDNSKGNGRSESKEVFKRKINTLLAYGLNDIVLCGGFGPNELDTYFDLRRYYRINFSIDAEKKLKNAEIFDVEKIKTYLSQLIRFDDPKKTEVEQTKKFLEKTGRNDWDEITIEDNVFKIHPEVFHAGFFPSTHWFAKKVRNYVKGAKDFCEVGCGSGVISCLVARSSTNLNVVATDINPFASENTKINAEQNGVGDSVQVYTGDVLGSIPKGQKFDVIFWALPFGYLDPGVKANLIEQQVFDPGYQAIRKFIETGRSYLKQGGRLLIGFSKDLGHERLLEDIAFANKLKLKQLEKIELKETDTVEFELIEGEYI
ncbi:MAG: GTP cyclohydrolase II [Simkaniaceae bacterium]|nr:GTP cyclohydrolase II [Candidatus Sacchlamyda saccharinae]